MLRMLNGVEVVCGNFYNDSRLMETLLQDVTTALPMSKDYRTTVIPSGHFHYSPAIIGAIIARNFHFLCYLVTDTLSGVVDVYADGIERQQGLVNQLITKHCQPATSCMFPLRDTLSFTSGNYVSFQIPFEKFGHMLDQMTVLANLLQLGRSYPIFIPPQELDQPEYDVLQIFEAGYISVHTAGELLEVDIMSKQELSDQTIQTWFPDSSNLRFLPRTF